MMSNQAGEAKCADSIKPKELDISSEAYRIYTYTQGRTLRIDAPETLYVLPGDSHRVVDAEGVTHRPTPGFLAISWKPRPGAPAFVA